MGQQQRRLGAAASILGLALLYALLLWAAADVTLAGERPNLILVLADDLGWTGTGSYGSEYYETPHIDRLAEQGIRFVNAYANMRSCAPSRASIMSGQYVGRHPVLFVKSFEKRWKRKIGEFDRHRLLEPASEKSLPKETRTLAESLRDAGYATAMFGKWHLGRGDQAPGNRGFEVAIEAHGKHFGFETDPPVEHAPDLYLGDFLTERAVEFIRGSHAEKKPFFLYLPHLLVHGPLEAKPDYLDHFERKSPGKYQRSPVAGAMIRSLDDSVGRILDTLDELEIADETLVAFTSDNGGLAYAEDGKRPENTSNAPLRGWKGREYDGGLRVPLILRWPGEIPPGSLSREAVSGADLFPTFLRVAGATLPEQSLDGVDLTPHLRDPTSRLPQRELIWYMPTYALTGGPGIALRRGDWKLIQRFDQGKVELYHTGKDIGETNDVAHEHPELVADLIERTAEWMREAGVPKMAPNPEYEPD